MECLELHRDAVDHLGLDGQDVDESVDASLRMGQSGRANRSQRPGREPNSGRAGREVRTRELTSLPVPSPSTPWLASPVLGGVTNTSASVRTISMASLSAALDGPLPRRDASTPLLTSLLSCTFSAENAGASPGGRDDAGSMLSSGGDGRSS